MSPFILPQPGRGGKTDQEYCEIYVRPRLWSLSEVPRLIDSQQDSDHRRICAYNGRRKEENNSRSKDKCWGNEVVLIPLTSSLCFSQWMITFVEFSDDFMNKMQNIAERIQFPSSIFTFNDIWQMLRTEHQIFILISQVEHEIFKSLNNKRIYLIFIKR